MRREDEVDAGEGPRAPEDLDVGPAATGDQTYHDSLVRCPWCGAQHDLFLEPPADSPDQVYYEECSTCGQDFRLASDWTDDGSPRIRVDRGGENE